MANRAGSRNVLISTQMVVVVSSEGMAQLNAKQSNAASKTLPDVLRIRPLFLRRCDLCLMTGSNRMAEMI